jgi:TatD DNase family protein
LAARIEMFPPAPASGRLIDTHCHLDMAAYDDDREELCRRFREVGVKTVITIGIDISSSYAAVALAEKHDDIWATIGVHPHDVGSMQPATYGALAQLYDDKKEKIVGFGEIGLDYCKGRSDPALQRKHFAQQLDVAHELGLPVIIHSRDADEDTYRLLKSAKPLDHGGVMHCFSGDITFAKQLIDLNLHISIPGIVTFANARSLQEVATLLPLQNLVLETDAPFLAPHPFRGKRNEPAFICHTAARIAELRGVSLLELADATTTNAERLFHLNASKRA